MPVQTSEREDACKTYFLRARKRVVGCRDGLDKLFFADGLRDIWSSFDALLSWKFPAGNNTDQRKLFAKKHQSTFPDWCKTDLFNAGVQILLSRSPVENMDNGKKIQLTDARNLLQILDFSYTVRSNLNHGAKHLEGDSPECVRNRELVEHSFKLTYDILEQALEKEGIIV